MTEASPGAFQRWGTCRDSSCSCSRVGVWGGADALCRADRRGYGSGASPADRALRARRDGGRAPGRASGRTHSVRARPPCARNAAGGGGAGAACVHRGARPRARRWRALRRAECRPDDVPAAGRPLPHRPLGPGEHGPVDPRPGRHARRGLRRGGGMGHSSRRRHGRGRDRHRGGRRAPRPRGKPVAQPGGVGGRPRVERTRRRPERPRRTIGGAGISSPPTTTPPTRTGTGRTSPGRSRPTAATAWASRASRTTRRS